MKLLPPPLLGQHEQDQSERKEINTYMYRQSTPLKGKDLSRF